MKKNVKRMMALAAAGILAAGALTGCGGGADTAKAEGAAASGEKKILKVAMGVPMLLTTGHSPMIPTAQFRFPEAMSMLTVTML